VDGGGLLKPASPVRRKSARLSKGTSLTKEEQDVKEDTTTNETAVSTAFTTSLPNIAAVKPSPKIEEYSTAGPITQSHAAPNSHANGYAHHHHDAITTDLVEKTNDLRTTDLVEEKSHTAHLGHPTQENREEAAPKVVVKQEIDWEIPRKALHSSIGASFDNHTLLIIA
jgi:hypothetical protein